MKSSRAVRFVVAVAIAWTVVGCAAIRRSTARNEENVLAAAGFRQKAADTPQRQQQLQSMPPLKLIAQPKGGKIVYRYADPYNCECLYVGDEQAYAEYRRLRIREQIADEQLEAAQIEEDAAFDWGVWGPWSW